MTIIQIQLLLAYLGLYQLKIDGIWGDGSDKGCRAFQARMGIGVDGIPGKQTQDALKKAVANGLPADRPLDGDTAFWAGIRYFTKAEFECHCGCGLNNVDKRLVQLCDDVREAGGVPFDISSPCRCEANNVKAGGVRNSRHLYGRAVDFRLRGKTASQTLSIVRADNRVAYCYAIDNEFVHMDIV